MARRQQTTAHIPLSRPSRDGPGGKTLIDLAQERQLFQQAREREAQLGKGKTGAAAGQTSLLSNDEVDEQLMSPGLARILESLLWGSCLSMLHFTLDVLVQHQYAVSLVWRSVIVRSAQAFAVFSPLLYVLHAQRPSQVLLPGLAPEYQHLLRQGIFFATAVIAGCYLVYTTNRHGYLAVMKQAPPLGCLWVWSVIELDLLWALPSLAVTAVYMWQGGYGLW